MERRQHRIQVLTLILCILLFAATLWQGRRIASLEEALWSIQTNSERNFQSIRGNLYQLSSDLEELGRHVRSWELRPAGLDQSGLLADLSLTLKEWREDTAVRVIISQGDDRQTVNLSNNGDGTFSGPGTLPLEQSGAIRLEASILQNGTNFQEDLGGWEDISRLLPVQLTGSGIEQPTYQDGILSARSWPDVYLWCDADGQPAEVLEAELRLYRNNRLEHTQAAVYDPENQHYASSAGDDDPWEVSCEDGDSVRIDFFCRDKYGLGYTFTLYSWELGSGRDYTAGGNSNGAMGSVAAAAPLARPVLSWN